MVLVSVLIRDPLTILLFTTCNKAEEEENDEEHDETGSRFGNPMFFNVDE